MAEFLMPSLGADMDAGTLVEWLRKPGDVVKHGDIVAVVETQKGAIEIEVFETGTIDRLLVEPGARVPVGTPLAIIRGTGESAATAPPPPPPVETPAPVPAAAVEAPSSPPPPPGAAPVPAVARISPAARKLAAERGIDPTAVKGTGPGGAVVSTDVEPQVPASQPVATPAKRTGIDLTEMRKAIAAAMSRSKREIPHYYLSHTIDLKAALDWLASVNARREPAQRLLLAVPLLKAVALSLEEYPEFNGTYVDDAFHHSDGIHLGTAIAIRGGGLVAPAIRDANAKSLDELMAALRDLVARTRAGRLRSSELFEATITVSSLGERGVESLLGVIYPPQVAIVGFGAPTPQPRAVDGRVEVRPLLTATLAADHRVSDGHRGALLLLEIDRLLQQPEGL